MDQQQRKANKSFLLAHHPSCENFSHHVIFFRGRRLCMGCFVMYPAALFSLLTLILVDSQVSLDPLFLIVLAVIMFCANAVRKFLLQDRMGKQAHIVFRAMLGVSLGLVLTSIKLTSGTEQIAIIAFALALAIAYNLINGKKNMDICRNCPQYSKFPKCDGFPDNVRSQPIGDSYK